MVQVPSLAVLLSQLPSMSEVVSELRLARMSSQSLFAAQTNMSTMMYVTPLVGDGDDTNLAGFLELEGPRSMDWSSDPPSASRDQRDCGIHGNCW